MKATVKFLGIYRDIAGARAGEYEVADPATVPALIETLIVAHPKLEQARNHVRVMVNGRQPEPGQLLQEGDELVVMGAIAGG